MDTLITVGFGYQKKCNFDTLPAASSARELNFHPKSLRLHLSTPSVTWPLPSVATAVVNFRKEQDTLLPPRLPRASKKQGHEKPDYW